MNKKLVTIALLLGLLVSSFVGVASASETVIVSFTDVASTSALNAVHPSSNSLYSAYLVNFTLANIYYPTHVTLKCYRVGTPVAVVKAVLMDEAYNVLEVSSNSLNPGTLGTSTTGSFVNWTFSGDTELLAGVIYRVGVFAESATLLDGSNAMNLRRIGSGINGQYYKNSAWSDRVSEVYLVLYGNNVPATTPTPTPTPTPAPTATPTATATPITWNFSYVFTWLLYFIIIAAVIVLLCIIGYAKLKTSGANR